MIFSIKFLTYDTGETIKNKTILIKVTIKLPIKYKTYIAIAVINITKSVQSRVSVVRSGLLVFITIR